MLPKSLALPAAALVLVSGCATPSVSLIELSRESATAAGIVSTELGIPALTSSLPSELTVEVSLPDEPFLDFSVAVLAARDLSRGNVRFSVRLEENNERFVVYDEVVRARTGRDWRRRRVNLSAWRNQIVKLTLKAEPAYADAVGAWAGRVEAAWGDPVIEDVAPGEIPSQPSIVLVLVDTLRRDYLGFHGFSGPVSPNLDWLAKESLVFDNAFSEAPWTKPSVASLFTSLHPDVHRLNNHGGRFGERETPELTAGILPSEAITIAETLQEAGYRTAAFVANPWLHARYGFDQGFDVYELEETGDGNELLDRARKWLHTESRDSAPFFLYLHFLDVHGPYDAPVESLASILASKGLDVHEPPPPSELLHPPPYLEGVPWFEQPELGDDGVPLGWGETIDLRLSSSRALRAQYAKKVMAFDELIAPFLNELRNSDWNDNTLLVLTSDHGEELLEHGGRGHGFNLYEHQIRIPLMMRMPAARRAGTRLPQAASLMDLMPTLLSWAGVETPSAAQGKDLWPLTEANRDALDINLISTATKHRLGVYAVRTKRYKLIVDMQTGTSSLFDLVTDPNEYRDIASNNQDVVLQLQRRLSDHLEEAGNAGWDPETAPIPDDLRKRLEALGYLSR